MPRVAIATSARFPSLHDDDRLFADALAALGCDVTPAVWDDPAVDWSAFDRVVIRSTWGYHATIDAYRRWVEGFRPSPGTLWNPPEVVAANLHKGYLLDLERAGIPIAPLVMVRAGEGTSLAEVLDGRGWSRAVVKPAISAGSADTWVVTDDPREAGPERLDIARSGARFRDLVARRDMLIQPFLPEILDEGEWSLVFLAGEYSHAFVKRPAAGDFRVQHQYGGVFRAASPPEGLIAQAARVLETVRSPLLFARVDGVVRDGRLLLLELEVNEPYLGFVHAPGSAGRLADAVLATLPG